MPLRPESLPEHPDGSTVNKVEPGMAGYRTLSKWRERVCGNCGWFQAQDVGSLPDISGDEHPAADRKGPVHRCALVGGGIAKGGYCEFWGTDRFCRDIQKTHRPVAEIILSMKNIVSKENE